MVLNELIFIFVFFPLAFIVDRLLPKISLKNAWLFLVSLIFYSWGHWKFSILLLLVVVWNYLSALQLDQIEDLKKRKLSFILSVVVNVLILSFYKCMHTAMSDFVFPIGLSFYLFSSISYLADVYMHKSKANSNLIQVGLYIGFFGKLLMGPIEQYHSMEDQLTHRKVDFSGILLFIRGLVKKVLFADQFMLIYTSLVDNHTFLGTWLMILSFSLQLYFDFSGYSDMAIGISKLFGFRFQQNFNHPYVAKSAQDFWRRWHISLSMWFKEYVYIPLGGNRGSNSMFVRNIFVVWLLTGVWHGLSSSYIAWGMYYALILLLEKVYIRKFLSNYSSWISYMYTFFVVVIGWTFFSSSNVFEGIQTIGRLFSIGTVSMSDALSRFMLWSHVLLWILGCVTCLPIVNPIQNVLYKKGHKALIVVAYAIAFVICIAFIVGSSYSAFLYAAF